MCISPRSIHCVDYQHRWYSWEVFVNMYTTQRAQPLSGRDCEGCKEIIEILSYLAILNNMGILIFTLKGSFNWELYDDGLMKGSNLNKLWGIVVLEHILIMLKMALSALIDDSPAWVVEEAKRERWLHEHRIQLADELAETAAPKLAREMSPNAGKRDIAIEEDILQSVSNFEPSKVANGNLAEGIFPAGGSATSTKTSTSPAKSFLERR